MLAKKRVRFIQLLCLGALSACQIGPMQTDRPESEVPTSPLIASKTETLDPSLSDSKNAPASAAKSPMETPAQSPTQSQSEKPASTAYQDAINLASGAATLGQQATSSDDWDLIVGRWEQAIQTLKTIPADHQHYSTAQTKLKDYGRHLAQAQQRLATLKQPPAEIALAQPATTSTPINRGPTAVVATAPAIDDATVPIIKRHGGTPVIEVTFNGKRYPMILDTGASHTHITRAMANDLGVQVVGKASVATASSHRSVVDVGYVQSIRVGDINRTNMPVSIGDTVPIGLLGNDVYKDYDVILQVGSVEFRPR